MGERSLRVGIFLACLAPFGWLVYGASLGDLGADPAETVMLQTGDWSLRMLALTLLASPLRSWSGSSLPLKLRRMLGLYAFFYSCLHFVAFLQFYIGWSADALIEELVERPYISAGFAAWLVLLPLALTSTRGIRRRMGARWVQLHKMVYSAAIISCLHLLWQARSDIGEALIYSVIFALLLAWRVRRAGLVTKSPG